MLKGMVITKMHLKNLWKQRLIYKAHYYISFILEFLEVNNNQFVELDHNQIMRCIICHNDFVGSKILAMCTKCRK